MKRRAFIQTLVSSVAAWPGSALAQRSPKTRRVGILIAAQGEVRLKAVREQLAQMGWREGSNLELLPRLTEARPEQISAYARELVSLSPDVILAGSSAAVSALIRETASIPIVFATVGDPVGAGFVKSLSRPGGNVTGFLTYEQSLSGKWLQLLKDMVPTVRRAVALYHQPTTQVAYYLQAFETSAQALGLTAFSAPIQTEDDIGTTLSKHQDGLATGMVVLPGPFAFNARDVIGARALEHKIASVSPYRESAVAGCLCSYGMDQVQEYRQAAIYVARVLAGERPSDLPVQQPTKFDLVLNNRTAKSLGVDLTPTILARADEIIE